MHYKETKFTLHTHTIGFDGQNTVQEMIDRAKALGFGTIGFSNHFIVHPHIKETKMYPYAVRGGYSAIYSDNFDEVTQKFVRHREELSKAREENKDMNILLGMEVDFFDSPEWRRGFNQFVDLIKPDYLIGSAHFIEYNGSLLNSHDWQAADKPTQDLLLQEYWQNVSRTAESGLFNWMAHLDLPKKVGLGREEKWVEYENKALESIASSNIAIEINTGFYRPECYEPYPSVRILKMAKEKNIPVLISDDAHKIGDIGRHFDEAKELINQLKLSRFKLR